MAKSREELLAEVQRLREQLDSRASSDSEPMMRSIVGLQDKVIQLDENGLIQYINSSLARDLGIDRSRIIGQPLAEIDKFKWGPGLLGEVLAEARQTPGTQIEREISFTDTAKGQDVFYQLKSVVEDDMSQIMIEDISNLRNIEKTFRRFVSPAVIEKMKELKKDFFKAERYEMSVLFADLRGFTSMSERMRPDDVRAVLNEYLEAMIDILFANNATLDKVVGDEVMALFGAPIYYEDHALRALSVAIQFQLRQHELVARWKKAGRQPVYMGIGINTGEMMVGNVGSEQAVNYTVIGHHVNLASRLCDVASPGKILLGQRTFDTVKRDLMSRKYSFPFKVKFRKDGEIQVKGVSHPVDVIGVVMKDDDGNEVMPGPSLADDN